MHAEHPSVDDRAQREVVKDLAAPPPDVRAAVLALAFVVEAVDLGEGSLARNWGGRQGGEVEEGGGGTEGEREGRMRGREGEKGRDAFETSSRYSKTRRLARRPPKPRRPRSKTRRRLQTPRESRK